MIKLSGAPSVEGYDSDHHRLVRVSLWADNENEMSGVRTGANIEGLNDTDVLTMGSTVLTVAESSFGRLGSDGSWSF